MSHRYGFLWAGLGFFLLLTLSGCGGDSLALVPVEGKVTIDGSPFSNGTVRFVPDRDKGNTSPVEPIGEVGADGTYKLQSGGRAGAPLGWYKVGVVTTGSDIVDSAKPNSGKSGVAKRFGNPASSGLAVEVVASPQPGAYDLKVTAK
jgi:hypothetical protein